MPYTKKFVNIKMGGAVGPQNLTASQVVLSSPVPCRGARLVLFHLFATDANAGAAFSFNAGNDATGGLMHAGGAVGLLSSGALIRMNASGGVTVAVAPPANAGYRLAWEYVQLSFTANAAGQTAFQVDVEVIYDGDAQAMRADTGQYATQPI